MSVALLYHLYIFTFQADNYSDVHKVSYHPCNGSITISRTIFSLRYAIIPCSLDYAIIPCPLKYAIIPCPLKYAIIPCPLKNAIEPCPPTLSYYAWIVNHAVCPFILGNGQWDRRTHVIRVISPLIFVKGTNVSFVYYSGLLYNCKPR